jgi:hypothetical protein
MFWSTSKTTMKYILGLYGSLLRSPSFLFQLGLGIILLETAYAITAKSAYVATAYAGIPVVDTIHSLFPRISSEFVHADITFFLFDLRYPILFLFLPIAPFALYALASCVLLRAVCINLTHIGMPDGIIPIVSSITFWGDLFFSGHVANTCMLGFIFWQLRPLRYLWFTASAILGISAILGRYHYTIDVVAAPFFAYGTFQLSRNWLFVSQYKRAFQFLNDPKIFRLSRSP